MHPRRGTPGGGRVPPSHRGGGNVPATDQTGESQRTLAAGKERPVGNEQPVGWDVELARAIDHTLLKPDATAGRIEALCQEAVRYGFHAVCVNSFWVPLAADLLKGTPVKVAAVVGFPLGASLTAVKAVEAREAVKAGATELDMVLNVGALKSGRHADVLQDIRAVVEAADGALVKVIIETGLLTQEEKVVACRLAVDAGAHFVKTSTGFGPGGATVEDVALMRKTVGPHVGVKASGGIRDAKAARDMLAAGANRLGTSSGIAIVAGQAAGTAGGAY